MHRQTAFLGMLLLVLCVCANAQDSLRSGTTPLSYFGMHIHRADAGTPWPPFRFGSWRLWDANVGWASLEVQRGEWNFRRLDLYVSLAERMGVELLLPLALTPTWASARPQERSGYRLGNAAEPRDLNDWRNYVQRVGERYRGKIRYYEIWNEPSDKTFFTGTVETLVVLAAEAHRILKSIDPQIQVVSPAPAGSGHHLKYLDDFFAKGGKAVTDIVGYHFYVWNTAPEAMIPVIREVRRIMARHGIGTRQLWNTETGYWIENTDGTKPNQAMVKGWRMLDAKVEAGAYLARAFVIGRGEGVNRFFWYSWDNLHAFGLREPTSGTPKPITRAYDRIVEWMNDRRLEGCARRLGVWECMLTQRGVVAGWIVWRDTGAAEPWVVPQPWQAKRRWDLFADEPVLLAADSIALGDTPIFVLR
jgi:hypothetical protein